jgi:hypothetical protein
MEDTMSTSYGKQKTGNIKSYAKRKKKYNWGLIGSVVFFTVLILFSIAAGITPRNSYLKEIKVIQGNVLERSSENYKYYIRVNNLYSDSNSVIAINDPWIEVTAEFFASHGANSEVGLLAGNYDIFKAKYFGLFGKKGQTYEKSEWIIDEIYNNYDAAVSANPSKKYTAMANVVKKKITGDGAAYFVLDTEGRQLSVPVSLETYGKYSAGSKVNCEFEAIGDFVKALKAGV